MRWWLILWMHLLNHPVAHTNSLYMAGEKGKRIWQPLTLRLCQQKSVARVNISGWSYSNRITRSIEFVVLNWCETDNWPNRPRTHIWFYRSTMGPFLLDSPSPPPKSNPKLESITCPPYTARVPESDPRIWHMDDVESQPMNRINMGAEMPRCSWINQAPTYDEFPVNITSSPYAYTARSERDRGKSQMDISELKGIITNIRRHCMGCVLVCSLSCCGASADQVGTGLVHGIAFSIRNVTVGLTPPSS